MEKKTSYIYFLLGAVIGALLVSAFGPVLHGKNDATSTNALRAQYYATEVATLVSPHSVRERMSHGDDSFVLIDTRAQADYEREHVAGAVNIDTSQSLDVVLAAFKALPENKQVIIYCYSAACMNGRKAGNFLADNGVYVQEMTIGWNEWRYGWKTWNYDTEWDTYKVEDYIVSGTEPGEVHTQGGIPAPCPIGGSLGC